MDLTTGALWLGRLLMAGYAVLVFIEMLRYFNTALVAPPPEPAPRERTPWKRLIPEVLAAFQTAVTRALVREQECRCSVCCKHRPRTE